MLLGARKFVEVIDYGSGQTNQSCEIMAAIIGLRRLRRPARVRIVTDSQYVTRCFSEGWLPNWRRKGWMHKGSERPNRELWETLEGLVEMQIECEFEWTRGHVGEPGNELANALANFARLRNVRGATSYDVGVDPTADVENRRWRLRASRGMT